MSEGFPSAGDTTIHFAHVAYRMEERYDLRNPDVNYFQTWTAEDTMSRIEEADVFEVAYVFKKKLHERLGIAAEESADRLLVRWWSRLTQGSNRPL